MSFIIGKKAGMTQIFDSEGRIVPVTVVIAGPMTVMQKKTVEVDGYNAVKMGFEQAREKSINKPDKGQFEKISKTPMKHVREYRTDDLGKYELGATVNVSEMFKDGDIVDVCGITKGKGYQGNIKRSGFHRGKETHGSNFHRDVGSLSSNSDPARVFKGRPMPGQMGVERVTMQNLTVAKVDADKNVLLIRGAIPGPNGGICTVKTARKSTQV
jgi:large subunit ribosomal protein L3